MRWQQLGYGSRSVVREVERQLGNRCLDGSWLDGSWLDGSRLDGSWLDGSWLVGYRSVVRVVELQLGKQCLDGSWLDGSWLDGSRLDGSWLDGSWLDGREGSGIGRANAPQEIIPAIAVLQQQPQVPNHPQLKVPHLVPQVILKTMKTIARRRARARSILRWRRLRRPPLPPLTYSSPSHLPPPQQLRQQPKPYYRYYYCYS
jgi:hypothetical protein